MCSEILPRVAPKMTSTSHSPKSSGEGKKKVKPDRDDWCNITETAERRRAQNRVSQRNHRQRIRNKIAQLEATIARAGEQAQDPFAPGYQNVYSTAADQSRRASSPETFFYGQVPTRDRTSASYDSSSPDVDVCKSSTGGTEGSFDTSFSPSASMDHTPSPVPGQATTASTTYCQSPLNSNSLVFNGIGLNSQAASASMNTADYALWDYNEEMSVENIMASPENTASSMATNAFCGPAFPTVEEQQISADQQGNWVLDQPRPIYPSRTLADGFASSLNWNQVKYDPATPIATPQSSEVDQIRSSNPAHYHLKSKQTVDGADSSRAYVTMVMLTEDGRCPGCACSQNSGNPGLKIRVPIEDLKHFPIEPQ